MLEVGGDPVQEAAALFAEDLYGQVSGQPTTPLP
jgi:hypothetical protein